ncbi:hypothetical protein EV562_101544 [Streptomyces sp. BK208]|nr:hypothetical protein EV562_101544 [Streptomyces sp. BK208]
MISIAVSGFALNGDCAPAAAEQACNEWWWQVGDSDWRELARSLMWLAPMAWPHTSGFAIRKLAQREIDVGRAVTRALMRRDYAAAARLCRWAALVEAGGATVGLDLGKVLERLELVSGGGPQTALHTVLGRLALTAGGAR